MAKYNIPLELATVNKVSDTLIFKSISEGAYFTYSEREPIIDKLDYYAIKYLETVKCLLPDRMKGKKLLYYNGIEWKELK